MSRGLPLKHKTTRQCNIHTDTSTHKHTTIGVFAQSERLAPGLCGVCVRAGGDCVVCVRVRVCACCCCRILFGGSAFARGSALQGSWSVKSDECMRWAEWGEWCQRPSFFPLSPVVLQEEDADTCKLYSAHLMILFPCPATQPHRHQQAPHMARASIWQVDMRKPPKHGRQAPGTTRPFHPIVNPSATSERADESRCYSLRNAPVP